MVLIPSDTKLNIPVIYISAEASESADSLSLDQAGKHVFQNVHASEACISVDFSEFSLLDLCWIKETLGSMHG